MFSIAYPSHAERQVYAQRAQRLRAPPLPAWCVTSPACSLPPPANGDAADGAFPPPAI